MSRRKRTSWMPTGRSIDESVGRSGRRSLCEQEADDDARTGAARRAPSWIQVSDTFGVPGVGHRGYDCVARSVRKVHARPRHRMFTPSPRNPVSGHPGYETVTESTAAPGTLL